MEISTLHFDENTGLIPVIIQDNLSGRVLMLGYMNREALQLTLETRKVTFFSRSRNQLWVKGETSGNFLHLVNISDDCDHDTLLIRAIPDGPTCHTGSESCFDAGFETAEENGVAFLAYLETFLKKRKQEMPADSYTSKMFTKGLDKIAQKVGEEAVETVIASKNDDEAEFIYEASDLLFHLTLLLVQKDIPLERIITELKRRHS